MPIIPYEYIVYIDGKYLIIGKSLSVSDSSDTLRLYHGDISDLVIWNITWIG